MKNHLKSFAVLIVALFIINTLLTGCNNNLGKSTHDELDLIREQDNTYIDNSSDVLDSDKDDKDEDEYKINKNNLVDVNSSISRNGIEYSNISIYKSKSLPANVKADEFDYYDIDYANSESLRSDISYMFITMNVKNTNSQNINLCWNNISPFIIEDKGDYYYNLPVQNAVPWEARYRSGSSKKTENSKDYYLQNLPANNKITITIGYLIDDEYLDDLRLCVVPESCDTTQSLEYNFMKCVMVNE